MKYCILIIDGAADWPIDDRGGKTCLELANTPNLDSMANEGVLGLARTVPQGMEPSSAVACMSVLGYDPVIYYRGRSAIEAKSIGVPIGPDDVVFRCNLVAVKDSKMWSYSSGYITTEEAQTLIKALDKELGGDKVRFFPGVSYRHICRITGAQDTLQAVCTPPHDISGKPIKDFLPNGTGSELLRDLMKKSEAVLANHPVNKKRIAEGKIPATTIWLFWSSGKVPAMPSFKELYKLDSTMTSAVDLLKGLAKMANMEILEIPGVTDAGDNDYLAQVEGALESLDKNDLVVIHIEAPDEAGHDGSVEKKVTAISDIDNLVVSKLRSWKPGQLTVLAMPDHPTPIKIKTHCDDPVPFLLWGKNFKASGAWAFTEKEAKKSGVYIANGHTMVERMLGGLAGGPYC